MRKVVAIGAGLALAASAGCGGDDGGDDGGDGADSADGKKPAPTAVMPSSVYFGAVAMTTDRLAIALDNRKATVFLNDGEPGATWSGSRARPT